ncbi:helix-turn-helix transcriptional regulator [Sphingomonas sp. NY01]|uniref:helix-turn-helix domain-containing protein n=1 Tax=Sphingomonas sp. NY01 TaxID=2968057 RepID=UPI00315D3516
MKGATSMLGCLTDTFSNTRIDCSQAFAGILFCRRYVGAVKVTVEQCRAGRALLNWSAAQLASAAELSVITVKRFEGGQNIASPSLAKIAETLTAAGVILIEDGAASPSGRTGVRLA